MCCCLGSSPGDRIRSPASAALADLIVENTARLNMMHLAFDPTLRWFWALLGASVRLQSQSQSLAGLIPDTGL